MAIVLSLVVLALANFVAADLRYTQAVNARAETLSTAQSGIDYGVARLRANQTLCATNAAFGGPVGLNGGAPTSPGSLNNAVTSLTCERTNANFAAIAGWSVIVTNTSSEAIKVQLDKDRSIRGPVYISDPSDIVVYSPSHLFSSDGDFWHRVPGCAGVLPTRILLGEPLARGPICTTANWSAIVSAPPLPDLNALPLGDIDGERFDPLDPDSCLVFAPGRYNTAPQIPDFGVAKASHVYFRSGDYWFENVAEWLIDSDAVVSAGHPGSEPAPTGDSECDAARLADPHSDGTGATFYFGGTSRLRVDDSASLDMFARQQGDFFVSIQALPSSNPGSGTSLVRTRDQGWVRLVLHGLLWGPNGRVVLDNSHSSLTVHRLLGGVVANQLWIGDSSTGWPTAAPDVVEPATGATDATIRLRSTSTRDGVTTTVEAIVQYRPQSDDVDQRVAVNSSRVVD